jgi:hypothetical protein
MDLHLDFKDLLAEFARFGVSYAVIGGYAVGYHSKPRATKDIDLLVSGTPENLDLVARALAVFGAPAELVHAARVMGPTDVVYLGNAPVRVDILRSADGIDTEEALSRAVTAEAAGLRIPIVALDDLIANKRAAGRPRDLADVSLLESVRRSSG